MSKKLLQSIIVFLFVMSLSINLFAQNYYMRQKSGTWFAGEINFPKMEDYYDYASGWNVNLMLKLRMSDRISLLGELPIAHGSVDDKYYFMEGNETGIGNIFVGLQTTTKIDGLSFELGIRLPTADEDKVMAYLPSTISDLEKYSSFSFNAWGASLLSTYQFDIASGVYGSAVLGPSLIIPKKDEYGDTELFGNYILGIGYKNERFDVSARLVGFMILSESDLDFDERTFHHTVFSASILFDRLEPGIILRLPMDEFSMHKFIFGISLGYRFND